MPISVARHRSTIAKRVVGYGSVVAFALTIGLVRSSHPVHAASTSSVPATNSGESSSANGFFGPADVGPAPASQAPSVSTGVS